jgi:uncharacterized phage protein gp47/JayE
MAEFGLNLEGFNRKRLTDIKASLEADMIEQFGDITVSPDSVFGQVIGVVSKPVDELWQELEAVYYSQYASAEGVSLDNVLDLTGSVRLAATRSFVVASLFGDEGTIVPADSQASSLGNIIEIQEDCLITEAACDINEIGIGDPQESTTYTVTIAGNVYSYESDPSEATEESILQGLSDEIDNGADATTEFLESGKLRITSLANTMNLVRGAGVDSERFSSPAQSLALEAGPIAIPINTLTNIVTAVTGWNEVDNFAAGTIGRNAETDAQARVRRRNSLRLLGSSSIAAIEARLLQEIDGIDSAHGFENDTDAIDAEDRPPHSIEFVVEGGLDVDIAELLQDARAAGIQTYGNTEVELTDSQGQPVSIFFSRPESVYIWCNISIELYDEEVFPEDGLAAIGVAVADMGNTLGSGKDVILQRLFTAVYTIPGVGNVVIEAGETATPSVPPVSFSTDNIAIDGREISRFDVSRIEVEVAT